MLSRPLAEAKYDISPYHIIQIVLFLVSEGHDWSVAFAACLPKRGINNYRLN